MGEPPFALGIQVTYTDVSEAVEMVGRSGASGTRWRETDVVIKVLESANYLTTLIKTSKI